MYCPLPDTTSIVSRWRRTAVRTVPLGAGQRRFWGRQHSHASPVSLWRWDLTWALFQRHFRRRAPGKPAPTSINNDGLFEQKCGSIHLLELVRHDLDSLWFHMCQSLAGKKQSQVYNEWLWECDSGILLLTVRDICSRITYHKSALIKTKHFNNFIFLTFFSYSLLIDYTLMLLFQRTAWKGMQMVPNDILSRTF